MTTLTEGDRGQAVACRMAMAVEITGMTTLTVLGADSGRSTALKGAGRGVMTGEAVIGSSSCRIMDVS